LAAVLSKACDQFALSSSLLRPNDLSKAGSIAAKVLNLLGTAEPLLVLPGELTEEVIRFYRFLQKACSERSQSLSLSSPGSAPQIKDIQARLARLASPKAKFLESSVETGDFLEPIENSKSVNPSGDPLFFLDRFFKYSIKKRPENTFFSVKGSTEFKNSSKDTGFGGFSKKIGIGSSFKNSLRSDFTITLKKEDKLKEQENFLHPNIGYPKKEMQSESWKRLKLQKSKFDLLKHEPKVHVLLI
jgi:hypothetical protein